MSSQSLPDRANAFGKYATDAFIHFPKGHVSPRDFAELARLVAEIAREL